MRRARCLSRCPVEGYPIWTGIDCIKGPLLSAALAFDDLERWGEILALSNFDLILGGIIGEESLTRHQVEIGDEVCRIRRSEGTLTRTSGGGQRVPRGSGNEMSVKESARH